MRFSLQNTQVYRDFDKVEIGEIFLDDDSYPYIKIPDVQSCYNHDLYNCVRLSDGRQWNFRCNEQVRIPISYNFKIDT